MLFRSIPSKISLSVDGSISTPDEEIFVRSGNLKVPLFNTLYQRAIPSRSKYISLIRSARLFLKTNKYPENGSRFIDLRTTPDSDEKLLRMSVSSVQRKILALFREIKTNTP